MSVVYKLQSLSESSTGWYRRRNLSASKPDEQYGAAVFSRIILNFEVSHRNFTSLPPTYTTRMQSSTTLLSVTVYSSSIRVKPHHSVRPRLLPMSATTVGKTASAAEHFLLSITPCSPFPVNRPLSCAFSFILAKSTCKLQTVYFSSLRDSMTLLALSSGVPTELSFFRLLSGALGGCRSRSQIYAQSNTSSEVLTSCNEGCKEAQT